jgi:hypothetical protein
MPNNDIKSLLDSIIDNTNKSYPNISIIGIQYKIKNVIYLFFKLITTLYKLYNTYLIITTKTIINKNLWHIARD